MTLPIPGASPITTELQADVVTLGNKTLQAIWKYSENRLVFAEFRDLVSGAIYRPEMPAFTLKLGDGTFISADDLKPTIPFRSHDLAANPGASVLAEQIPGKMVEIHYLLPAKKLNLTWRAILRDGANYIRQEIVFSPGIEGVIISELTMFSLALPGASVAGLVRGSPVITDTLFFGIEHPAASSQLLETPGSVDVAACSFSRGVPLPAGQPYAISAVIGVAGKGQMRRDFNNYLEHERARPYRQFLHYNSWYDLNIERPGNRMEESEAIKVVDDIGTEMTTKRGVTLASYVMDDGWDSHVKIWEFHDGFPNGFTNVAKAAEKYGSGLGLWMSPWGGYHGIKAKRLENGAKLGYEINANGFSMAGPNYRAHFLDTCLRMIRDYHANFFKFDGMGGGNLADGRDSAYANDMDAIIGVCRELRKADPNVFISATVGTWPSPFWLRYVDSIWRQGEDAEYIGVGNGRERWITYRDATVHDRIIMRGPLYPIQSLMIHGILIGDREIPARMERTEESVRNEARSFFGSGTGIQELYISPRLLTAGMWDSIAEAAKWAQRNEDCLVDSHWIGGDPGKLEIYGFASWIPGKGTVTLRNPSDQPQTYALDVGAAFELPAGTPTRYTLKSPWVEDAQKPATVVEAGKPLILTLKPFEVITFEALP